MGKDGMECAAYCPANCDAEQMMCPGGEDNNGCTMPETCMPSKGSILMLVVLCQKTNNLNYLRANGQGW